MPSRGGPENKNRHHRWDGGLGVHFFRFTGILTVFLIHHAKHDKVPVQGAAIGGVSVGGFVELCIFPLTTGRTKTVEVFTTPWLLNGHVEIVSGGLEWLGCLRGILGLAGCRIMGWDALPFTNSP